MVKRLAIALMPLLLVACTKEQLDDCITSAGPMRTEERSLGAFQAIELNDRVDLLMEQRASGSVAVEAGRNLLGQVITEVRDGVLYIRNDNRCNWVRSLKPRITVKLSLDDVRELTLRGTGNVSATDTLRTDLLNIQQWSGQGIVELPVSVSTCIVGLHTGAGEVRLSGTCSGRLELFSGIMAPIDASALRARDVSVNNSGVADIRCWATEVLDARLYNVGDVYYRGDPPTVQSSATGTGRLIRE
ncbi:MAG: DUF2807 domain-containing protein [Flavobacteriales bacterium]|nr:DUF2807 domain-containing protein [Flavobacteriales bacterium]